MGYKGVSFPLKLNSRGGILLSDTTAEEPTHLAQALQQLLNTKRHERIMEVAHFCDLEKTIFETDESAKTMCASIIADAIDELEERVSVTEDDIEIETNDDGIVVTINFVARDLGISATVPIQIGGTGIE